MFCPPVTASRNSDPLNASVFHFSFLPFLIQGHHKSKRVGIAPKVPQTWRRSHFSTKAPKLPKVWRRSHILNPRSTKLQNSWRRSPFLAPRNSGAKLELFGLKRFFFFFKSSDFSFLSPFLIQGHHRSKRVGAAPNVPQTWRRSHFFNQSTQITKSVKAFSHFKIQKHKIANLVKAFACFAPP